MLDSVDIHCCTDYTLFLKGTSYQAAAVLSKSSLQKRQMKSSTTEPSGQPKGNKSGVMHQGYCQEKLLAQGTMPLKCVDLLNSHSHKHPR